MPSLPLSPPMTYTCPGEQHAISRAVHQARLSLAYAGCRDCPHREDAGLVSPARLARPAAAAGLSTGLEFTADGVRGRYLNDLTRREARQWATALAVSLWNDRPLMGRIRSDEEAGRPIGSGPRVAVGYDERPMSPDLAMGVVTALRQSGCQVFDVGQTTAPAWRFAAEHLRVDAGVLVTGAGCDASWTGLDFLGAGRLPLSPQPGLSAVVVSSRLSVARPTRFAGAVQAFAAWTLYESQLSGHFHALRPLRVAAVCLSPLLERMLSRLFEPLPCRLTLVAGQSPDRAGAESNLEKRPLPDVCGPWTPERSRGGSPLRWDVAQERLQAALRAADFDVGVLFGEDAAEFAICDERGEIVAPSAWQPFLLAALVAEQPGTQIVAADGSLAEFVERLQHPRSAGGVDPRGRFWHGGEHPACDALLTLATLLRTLSWSDAPLSERLR